MKIDKNGLDSSDMLSKLEEKKLEYEILQQKRELRQQELIKRTQNAKKVVGISIVLIIIGLQFSYLSFVFSAVLITIACILLSVREWMVSVSKSGIRRLFSIVFKPLIIYIFLVYIAALAAEMNISLI